MGLAGGLPEAENRQLFAPALDILAGQRDFDGQPDAKKSDAPSQYKANAKDIVREVDR